MRFSFKHEDAHSWKKKTNYSFPISMEEDGFSILLALLIK